MLSGRKGESHGKGEEHRFICITCSPKDDNMAYEALDFYERLGDDAAVCISWANAGPHLSHRIRRTGRSEVGEEEEVHARA